MKKKWLSILLCVCMALSLLPTAALATTYYGVRVGDVLVTSDNASDVLNDGRVSYDVGTSTLTLTGASVTSAAPNGPAISANSDLNIVLIGNSTVTGPDTTDTGNSYGVYSSGSISISGTGKLTVSGGPATSYDSYGIYAVGAISVSGGTVIAAGGTGNNSYGVSGDSGVTVSTGATVNATGGTASTVSIGVNSDSGVISISSSVNAIGGTAGNYSYGVSGNSGVTVSTGATVSATGGTAANYSFGVYGKNGGISISGSVTAKGGSATATGGYSYGLDGYDSITVATGATVDATGGDATKNSGGVCSECGSISISGSVTARGGSATDTGGCSYGLDSYTDITVNPGATVTATGGDADDYSYGVSGCTGSVTVNTGATVIALSGAANYSYGVYGCSGITVSAGATVTSTGGTASSESIGVNSDSGSISITGSVTAIGGSATASGGSSYSMYGSTDITVNPGATVTATGGEADDDSYGVFGNGTINISGGSVTAKGGTTASYESSGIYGNGAITVSGGSITATGGTATTDTSYGIYTGGTITVSGGTVTATGGEETGDYCNSYGIYGNDDIAVSSGSVTAEGKSATGANGCSYGIYGFSNITVNTGAAVTAASGAAAEGSYGLYSDSGDIAFSGIVDATGGTVTSGDSFGVYGGSSISVTASTTIAGGDSQAMSLAPDLTGYTGVSVLTGASADGSNTNTWDNTTGLDTYQYLKIGQMYALTVDLYGGSGTTASSSYMAGDVVSISAGTKSGYTFSGWTATGGGIFASASTATTTYTMPAGAAAITANWAANPTVGGGGGISTSKTVTVSVFSDSGTVSVSASVSGTTATVSATNAQLQQITTAAGTAGTVAIDLSALTVNTVVVPSKMIAAADGASGLGVTLSAGSVTLDGDALGSVVGKGDVTFSVETVDNAALTDIQRAALGNQADSATVVDVNLYAGGSRVSTFGNGALQISIPYTLKSGESADSITVWFVKDDGTIEPKNGTYADGKITFTTEHLSQYLIVNFPFTDVAESAWFYGSVAYAYNSGLFAGTSDTTFSPNTAMTRQMIWMVLARMDGKTPADMDAARAWAMETGISDGSNPTNSITRQQMAAILYHYAQYKGYDVSVGENTNILSYGDALTISEYAIPALQWACGSSLIQGSGNNLMPFGAATRAQVATIFQRFSQNVAK